MLISDGSLLMGVAALITSLANLIAVLQRLRSQCDIAREGPGRECRRYDR